MLGERLSYILLPGLRTQDEAAEDPLTAAKASCAADYELYWQNKLRKPLTEILTTCLSPAALQVCLRSAQHCCALEQTVCFCCLKGASANVGLCFDRLRHTPPTWSPDEDRAQHCREKQAY